MRAVAPRCPSSGGGSGGRLSASASSVWTSSAERASRHAVARREDPLAVPVRPRQVGDSGAWQQARFAKQRRAEPDDDAGLGAASDAIRLVVRRQGDPRRRGWQGVLAAGPGASARGRGTRRREIFSESSAASTSSSVWRSSMANSVPRRRMSSTGDDTNRMSVWRSGRCRAAGWRPSARSLRASGCRWRSARRVVRRPRSAAAPSPGPGRPRVRQFIKLGPNRRSTKSIASSTARVGIGGGGACCRW